MIAIIDYGSGNVRAFANVYKKLNIPAMIAQGADDLKSVSKLILPGVGAFDHTMRMLEKSGLRSLLDELVQHKHVPVLGICMGMQMLANSSEEGRLPGLGWIEGQVKKFRPSLFGESFCVPHLGWNTIRAVKKNRLQDKLDADARFYFLHSYYFACRNRGDVIAETDYGLKFASAINSKNIYGVQFHPEKSHYWGTQLLENFARL
jgi:glutamine amidotransferase